MPLRTRNRGADAGVDGDCPAMPLPHPVAERLARLAPDQRAAATAPAGPVLVRRAGGQRQDHDARRADRLADRDRRRSGDGSPRSPSTSAPRRSWPSGSMPRWRRSASSRAPSGSGPSMRSGREVLRDAGRAGRAARRSRGPPARALGRRDEAERGRLDTAFSRLKLDFGVDRRGRSPRIPRPDPSRARSWPTRRALAATRRSRLRRPRPRAPRRARDGHRPARPLARPCAPPARRRGPGRRPGAAPAGAAAGRARRTGSSSSATTTSRSTAGGSPTSAESSALDDALPGLRRVDLEVNYRCPAPVVERAVRLIEHNDERFAKVIRAGPAATGPADPRARTLRTSRSARAGDRGPGRTTTSTRAVLARTNRELLPGGRRGDGARRAVPGAARRAARSTTRGSTALLARRDRDRPGPANRCSSPLGRVRDARRRPTAPNAIWRRRCWPGRPPYRTSPAFVDGRSGRRAPRLAELRRDDARLTLATAHATKGLEFDHVVGRRHGGRPLPERAGGRPSARTPPGRYEEERRLGYVAWTRARRSLTLLLRPGGRRPRSCSRRSAAEELGLSPASG